MPTGEGAVKVCAAGFRPSDDGLIDDFEDGDSQLSRVADRGGYWFTSHDPNGSVIDPTPFKISGCRRRAPRKRCACSAGPSSDAGAWEERRLRRELRRAGGLRRVRLRGHLVQGKGRRRSLDEERAFQHRRREHPPRRRHLQVVLESLRKGRGALERLARVRPPFRRGQTASWLGDPVPALTPSKLIALSWAVERGNSSTSGSTTSSSSCASDPRPGTRGPRPREWLARRVYGSPPPLPFSR